jgi:outer membrane protein OmpA-like peptidoglycan-associated protein
MGEDGVGHQIYSLYDHIYLDRGSDGGVRPGQRFLIIRPWNDVTAPEAEAFKGEHQMTRQFGHPWYKDEYLGQYYQDIGQLEIKYVYPTKSTAQVTYVCDAPMVGDFLIPFEERPRPEFKPTDGFDRFAAPSGKAVGQLLPGKDFGHAFGEGRVLYVTLGVNDGVVVGDYVRLFRAATGSVYRGVSASQHRGHWKRYRGVPEGVEIPPMPDDLPREVLGEALVLRVEENTSTAIVTHSVREILAGDYAELLPPAPPLAQITVSPDTINRGETATLSWNARLAEQIQITGLGAVGERKGTINVNPTQTTTYQIAVSGRGGQAQDAATLTVIQPPPPPPPPPPGPTLEELFAQYVQDIFFEFDRDEITPQASAKLERVAAFLRDNPEARILIEGHCDEIGSDKYNVRLGSRRAEVTKNHLVSLGANPAQLDGVSRGRTRQFCSESMAETCRQLNRRAHFVLLR